MLSYNENSVVFYKYCRGRKNKNTAHLMMTIR